MARGGRILRSWVVSTETADAAALQEWAEVHRAVLGFRACWLSYRAETLTARAA